VWTCLHGPAALRNTLGKAGKAASSLISRAFLKPITIIDDFRAYLPARGRNLNPTMLRAAVPDHIGHALTHHPSQNSIDTSG
jgi:hypothetical protein